jgi:hypothetical protein
MTLPSCARTGRWPTCGWSSNLEPNHAERR